MARRADAEGTLGAMTARHEGSVANDRGRSLASPGAQPFGAQ